MPPKPPPENESSTTSADAPPSRGATRTNRRSRARKGEGPRLRDEILAATEELLLRSGSAEAVSIRAVADAVGVTPPSIYRHFSDKNTLIYEVCARHFTNLREHIQKAVVGIRDPIEALVARGAAYVQFGITNPEPYRILFMTRPDDAPLDEQENWFNDSEVFNDALEAVQAAIDAGRFRPEYTDAFLVTLGFWARVHGLTSLAVSKPFLPIDDEFLADYADVCLRGIVRH